MFIHENFFEGAGTTSGLECHEISLYFLMKSRGTQEIYSDSYCPEGKEFMKWIPIKDLEGYKAYPDFFKDRLNHLPLCVEHIITRDIKVPKTNSFQSAIS